MILDISLISLGYLMGSLSSAIIICKLFSLPDPRAQGSGNPGATNVLRFGGKKIALLVLSGDILKGFLPVLIAQYAGIAPMPLALVAFAAFLGHLFPVFFGFQGGKGVATALGVLLGLAWPLGLSVIAIWLLMATVFRISSLAAIAAAVAAPLITWLILPQTAYVVAVLAMSILLLIRHRSNITKLRQGIEPRIGGK